MKKIWIYVFYLLIGSMAAFACIDHTGDGITDNEDVDLLVDCFGSTAPECQAYDNTGDGKVDINDLANVLSDANKQECTLPIVRTAQVSNNGGGLDRWEAWTMMTGAHRDTYEYGRTAPEILDDRYVTRDEFDWLKEQIALNRALCLKPNDNYRNQISYKEQILNSW